jgi:hypothetical protein
MKKLLLVFFLLVLLAGGFGALTTFKVIPDLLGLNAMLGGLLGIEEPEAEAEAEAEPAAPDYGPVPVFLQVPQMAVPIIAGGVGRGHLVLAVRLNIAAEASVDVKRMMPRLTDAYLTGLMKRLPEITDSTGRLVDLPAVKAALREITESLLSRDQVRDVLIQNAYVR